MEKSSHYLQSNYLECVLEAHGTTLWHITGSRVKKKGGGMFEFLTRLVDVMLPVRSGLESNKKVLIVEDDLTLEPFWDAVFYKIDPSIVVDWVVTAEAGEVLISRSQQSNSPYSLVVSDLFLLGSNTGVDLWRKCSPQVPHFVLISVIEQQKLLHMCGRKGKQPTVICKPLDAKECVRVMKAALDGRHEYAQHYT